MSSLSTVLGVLGEKLVRTGWLLQVLLSVGVQGCVSGQLHSDTLQRVMNAAARVVKKVRP